MEDDSPAPGPDPAIDPTDLDALAGGDPEIRALLDFEPVARKAKRSDGWPPELQRAFIALLARVGNYNRAAQAVGRSGGGADALRRSPGSEEFCEAWRKAMALFHARNLQPVRMLERPAPPPPLTSADLLAGTAAAPPAAAPPARDPEEIEADERVKEEAFAGILKKYRRKLAQERAARLEGRIVEADFLVRQLTYIEVMLDLGGEGLAAHDLLQMWRKLTPGEMLGTQVAATPMSVFLDGVRREVWAEKGEPDRPPLGPLGEHDHKLSTGPCQAYNSARDGDQKQWRARNEKEAALAAQRNGRGRRKRGRMPNNGKIEGKEHP